MGCRRGVLLVWAGGQALLVAALDLVGAHIDVGVAVAVAVDDPRVAGQVEQRQGLESGGERGRVDQRRPAIDAGRIRPDAKITCEHAKEAIPS